MSIFHTISFDIISIALYYYIILILAFSIENNREKPRLKNQELNCNDNLDRIKKKSFNKYSMILQI